MTADEIRNSQFECDDGAWEAAHWLKEVAAQLAEQNEAIRQGQTFQRAVAEEDRAARIKRDELLAASTAGIDAVRENFKPQSPVRVEFPGQVTHLGCIIREPDGAYKIATNQGELLELAEADFQRIFAPPVPAEAKPS